MTRHVTVDLPCGCPVELVIPDGVDVDVERVDCPAGEHGMFLVTWRQLVAVTAVPLEVPGVEAEGVLVTIELGDTTTADVDSPPALPEADGAGAGPGPTTADEWKANVKGRDFSHALLLQQARTLADAHKIPKPRTLDDIDDTLAPLVLEWLDANWPVKP